MGSLSWDNLSASRRVAALVLCGIGSLLFSGCAREPIPDYVLSDATKALPKPQDKELKSHQEQIEAALVQFFGRPTNPRFMKPGEAVESESTDGDGESAATPIAPVGSHQFGGVQLVEAKSALSLRNGATVYRARCAGCHGITGDGNGPAAAYLQPKPRDYRRGVFKFTSTPYGYKPARADLIRTIRRGAKGTSMPAFPWMSLEDLNDVIDYLVSLSQRGEVEVNVAMLAETDYEADETIDEADFIEALTDVQESWATAENSVVLPVTAQPSYTEETIVEGRKAFLTLGCSKCHGENAKGQTEWLNPEFLAEQTALPEAKRIKINYDAWGQPAPAADITARMLHGGRRPIDIYRRIYTGINGTPMPAFGEIQPATIWHLVHYVMSIVEGGDPTANISAESILPATDATAVEASVEEEAAEESSADEAPAEEPTTEAPADDAKDASAADAATSEESPAEPPAADETPAEDATPAEAAPADSAATLFSPGLDGFAS